MFKNTVLLNPAMPEYSYTAAGVATGKHKFRLFDSSQSPY